MILRLTTFLVGFLWVSVTTAQDVPVVTLGALNKITAKLETIKISRDEKVRFGTLEITMHSCQSNPPEETPESVAFIEVVDYGQTNVATEIFKGWMFASGQYDGTLGKNLPSGFNTLYISSIAA